MIKINKKIVLISLLSIALLSGGLFTLYRDRLFSPDETKTSFQTPAKEKTESVDLSPPTNEDIKRVEENKERLVADPAVKENITSESSVSQVKPIVTYAGRYGSSVEVGGYIDVFEEDGICTAIFSQGAKQITKSVQAVRSAKTTDCPVIAIPTADFNPKGQYTLVLSYQSSKTKGSSDIKTIEVQ
jgi:hypothetical protein